MSSSADFVFFSQEERLQLLSGNCPRHLTKARLRTWLSYRVGTVKDGSASSDANKLKQRDVRSFFLRNCQPGITVFFFLPKTHVIFCRVVSYIKNGWENNLSESWKHLASDAKNVDVFSSSKISPNTPHKFQQAANWCFLQRAELPSFTIENMMNYFIKRKSPVL